MAKLPTTLGEAPVPRPQRTVHTYDPTPIGRAAIHADEAMAGLGEAGLRLAKAKKEQEDKDAILQAQRIENEARQQAMNFLYDPNDGILTSDQYKGAGALGLKQKTQQFMQGLSSKSLGQVTNPLAQAALSKSMSELGTSLNESAMKHESNERIQFRGAQVQQSADLDKDSVGLDPLNEKNFLAKEKNTFAAAKAKEQIEGRPPGFYSKDAVSDLASSRVLSLFNSGDPAMVAKGGELYDQYMKDGKLGFKAQIELGHTVKTVVPKAAAQAAFNKDYSAAASAAIPMDIIKAAQRNQESGGRQANAAGGVLTSAKGAKGVMQVMPDTAPEAAKLAGVAWDPKLYNDAGPKGAEYNQKLGDAYMDAQVSKFGDTRIALAAYNMGPGWVQDLINGTNESTKNPKKIKTGNDPDAILAAAPAETKAYVANIMGAASAAAGPPVISLADAQAKATKMPQDQADNYLSMVTAHNSQITAAQKQQQNDVLAKIQPILEQTNGNVSAIPVALEAEARKAGVWDKVREYKGFTDEGYKNALNMMDTEAFSAVDLSDPAVRLRLNASDYAEFSKKQADMVNDPKNATMSRRVDEAVKYVFQTRLGSELKGARLVDGNPTYKLDAKDQLLQNKVLRFKALVQQQIQDEYARTNKVPSSAEVFKISNSIVSNEVTVTKDRSSWSLLRSWSPTYDEKIHPADLELKDIPEKARAAIEAARAAARLPITEAGILSDYLMVIKQRSRGR